MFEPEQARVFNVAPKDNQSVIETNHKTKMKDHFTSHRTEEDCQPAVETKVNIIVILTLLRLGYIENGKLGVVIMTRG